MNWKQTDQQIVVTAFSGSSSSGTGSKARVVARIALGAMLCLGLPLAHASQAVVGAEGVGTHVAESIVTSAGSPGVGAPVRVIVKLRAAAERTLADSTDTTAGVVDIQAARAANPSVATLLDRHGVHKAAPLYPERVRARTAQGLSETELAARTRQRFPVRAARAPQDAQVPDLAATYLFDLGERNAADVAQVLASLRADPDVVYAEEDKRVGVAFTPNDPRYSELWGMPKIRAYQAWDTARGAGAIVAVIDTGVDYNHPDLDNNLWTNSGEIPGNGVDDDGNGMVDDRRGWDFVGPTYVAPTPDNDPIDVHGHGTHVSGTIAAEGNNAIGVIGVAFNAKIMMTRALDDGGWGPDSSIASAIIYAADNGADVINASFGGTGTSQAMLDAVNYAHAHGVVFVAAAGNNGADVSASSFYPAVFPNAIAVAAVDAADNKAWFSNHGSKIDLAAPGMEILSLEAHTGGYVAMQGTSMAAPHVAGAAALVLGLHPNFTSEQVRQVLRTSAIDIGTPGKDWFFGYGRLNAAGAVLVNQALEAKIYSPFDYLKVRAPVPLTGSAQGAGFASYVVEFGAGKSPSTWTQIRSATTPIASGNMGTFNPTTLADGIHTVRLTATDTSGRKFSDHVAIEVDYVEITSPMPSDLTVLTPEAKPGAPLDIIGSATGPSFQSYRIEWAPGRDATSGWSISGTTLTGNGTSPLDGALLGRWTPPLGATGEYTVRLVVTNTGFLSDARSTVNMEPDLASGYWPKFLTDNRANYGPTTARMTDGSSRIIACGSFSPSGTSCVSFTGDGSSQTTILLDRGLDINGASAGQLDAMAGDEVVIPDDRKIRIVTPDLTPIRDIVTPRQESFSFGTVTLSDLDGDGVMEIVALAHDAVPGGNMYYMSGSLQVYRADGTLYSANYPRRITSPHASNEIDFDSVVVDLDGDGNKEILLLVKSPDYTWYEIQALHADGTTFAAWPTPYFPMQGAVGRIRAADLDHDGNPELLVSELPSGASPQLRVLNSDGTTRPGWPVAGIGGDIAIGDIDGDGKEEIVGSDQFSFLVLRPDGTLYPAAFPTESRYGAPVIADVDNDGFPDIVRCSYWNDVRMKAISRTGAVIKDWRLTGMNGRQPTYVGIPLVGNFVGDGKTDIAVQVPLIDGGGAGGSIYHSKLTMLTTGAPFNASGGHWPMIAGDPQNSRVRMPHVAVDLPGEASNLRVSKGAPGQLTLQWGADCGAATTYGIYRGDLRVGYGSIAAEPGACNVTGTSTAIPQGAGVAEFFLVVPHKDGEEGSYGTKSSGAPRPPAEGGCYPQGPFEVCAP